MSDYLIQSSTLEDIADAIRSKTGGSALINPEDMADEIDSISTGGGSYGHISLADSSLWEQGSLDEGAAVGSTYEQTGMTSTKRIRLKSLVELHDFMCFSHSTGAYWLQFYDENGNYIGWSVSGWIQELGIMGTRTSINLTKRKGNMTMADAKYVGIAVYKGNTTDITPEDAATINLTIDYYDNT